MTKHLTVVPTLSAPAGGAGPQSALKPVCDKCDSADNVVRMWHGPVKFWVCSQCYKIGDPTKKEATLRQRIFHKLPEPEEKSLTEVLPNRAARRRR